MNDFAGTFFDGQTLAARPVSATVDPERTTLRVTGPEIAFTWPWSEVRFSTRLADTPRYAYLPGGCTLATTDNSAVDALLAGRRFGPALIHWLEERAIVAVLAVLLLVSMVAAAGVYGLPALARRAAASTPPAIEATAGEAVLSIFDQVLGPSQLGPVDRARVDRQLARILAVRPQRGPVRLEFRNMGELPNAFAVPGGTIIVSDSLVRLAELDEHLAAVLAHELGHLEMHHGMQSVLRSSSALLLVTALTGDLSTLVTFSSSLPAMLLQTGYSREFEREADRYAVAALRSAGTSPRYLANILERLESARPGAGPDYSYLSTHPGTLERAQTIRSQPP